MPAAMPYPLSSAAQIHWIFMLNTLNIFRIYIEYPTVAGSIVPVQEPQSTVRSLASLKSYSPDLFFKDEA
jgi:hypothetical protein